MQKAERVVHGYVVPKGSRANVSRGGWWMGCKGRCTLAEVVVSGPEAWILEGRYALLRAGKGEAQTVLYIGGQEPTTPCRPPLLSLLIACLAVV